MKLFQYGTNGNLFKKPGKKRAKSQGIIFNVNNRRGHVQESTRKRSKMRTKVIGRRIDRLVKIPTPDYSTNAFQSTVISQQKKVFLIEVAP